LLEILEALGIMMEYCPEDRSRFHWRCTSPTIDGSPMVAWPWRASSRRARASGMISGDPLHASEMLTQPR